MNNILYYLLGIAILYMYLDSTNPKEVNYYFYIEANDTTFVTPKKIEYIKEKAIPKIKKDIFKDNLDSIISVENNGITYNDIDILNLAKVMSNESGWDTLDQYRVGVTVLNRYNLTKIGERDFTGGNKPASISNILNAPKQFTSVWKKIIPTQETIERAERVILGDIPQNCVHEGLYFYNPNNPVEPEKWILANRRKKVCAKSANGHIHTK